MRDLNEQHMLLVTALRKCEDQLRELSISNEALRERANQLSDSIDQIQKFRLDIESGRILVEQSEARGQVQESPPSVHCDPPSAEDTAATVKTQAEHQRSSTVTLSQLERELLLAFNTGQSMTRPDSIKLSAQGDILTRSDSGDFVAVIFNNEQGLAYVLPVSHRRRFSTEGRAGYEMLFDLRRDPTQEPDLYQAVKCAIIEFKGDIPKFKERGCLRIHIDFQQSSSR